jgi:SUKH-4 immunity protein of toxin-antitoxin system
VGACGRRSRPKPGREYAFNKELHQMLRLDFAELREFVAARLPPAYEPGLLTFYGRDIRRAGDDVVIGDDYGTELCIRPDGTVVSIDREGKLPMRFVNSSLEHFAQFLEMVSATDRTDDQSERAMWSRLTVIDPPAFDNEDNWWALVWEQARQE